MGYDRFTMKQVGSGRGVVGWGFGGNGSGTFLFFLAVGTHVLPHVAAVLLKMSAPIGADLIGIVLAPLFGTSTLSVDPFLAFGLVVLEIIGVVLAPNAHAFELAFFLAIRIGANGLPRRIFTWKKAGLAMAAKTRFHPWAKR